MATASAPARDARAKAPHVKIKKNAVTSLHIKNGTIQAKDLSKKVRAAIAAIPAPAPVPDPVPVPAPAPYTPPKVYAAAPEDSVNVPFDSDTEVVKQVLPAGTYAVQANLTLYSNQAGLGSCTLLVDSDSYNMAQQTFPAGGGRTSLTLSSVIVAVPAKPVSIECWTPGVGNAGEIQLTAIQVTQ